MKKLNDILRNAIQEHRSGNLKEAEKLYKLIIKKDNRNYDALHLLGVINNKNNKPEIALELIQKALKYNPNLISAYSNRGISLMLLNLNDDAIESFKKSIEMDPNLAQPYNNIGLCYMKMSKYSEALNYFSKALIINPKIPEIYNNIGLVYHYLKNYEESLSSYKKAIEISPAYADAHSNMGVVLLKEKKYKDALISINEAIKFDSNLVDAYTNKSLVLQEYWRFDEALACLEHALEINPLNNTAHNNLIFFCAYNDFKYGYKKSQIYGLVCSEKRAFKYDDWIFENDNKRLRIGFVSPDFRKHPVSYFLESFLPYLKLEEVELIAYTNCSDIDETTNRIKINFKIWREIYQLNDIEVAELIHSDKINILIDLSGHTDRTRLPVFSYKPAPVQVSWLGFFATTGLNEIDYFLGDNNIFLNGDQEYFTEKIWPLPETAYCFSVPQDSEKINLFDYSKIDHIDSVIFGSFNRLVKLNPNVIRLWSRILLEVPFSKLFICADSLSENDIADNLCSEFEKNGISKNRLILRDWNRSRLEHLSLYNSIHIALDPFPYSGVTTSMEALWMGVPVLTLKGDRYLSRSTESFNINLGLEDWNATNENDYINKAKYFSSNINYLKSIKINLRERVLASPLFDGKRFAINFATALSEMWNIYIKSEVE